MDPKLYEDVAKHKVRRTAIKAAEKVLHSGLPLDYLVAVMLSDGLETKERIDAAKALLPYFHSKKPNETILEVREPITAIVRKVI